MSDAAPAKFRFRSVLITLLVIVFMFFGEVAGIPTITLPVALLTGWYRFIARVLPQTHISQGGLFTTIACLVGMLCFGQIVGRWFHSHWRLRWTIVGAAITVLMFLAGTAVVGITHQSAWIARSPQPLWTFQGRGREVAYRVHCQNTMRQLWTAVSQYAEKNAGRLPDSLAEVAAVGDWTRYDFACRARLEEADVADEKLTPIDISRMVQLGEVHYVYLGRGETLKSVQKRPVLVEPLRNHGEGVNVCYGDGSTEWLSEADAEAALRGKPSLDPTGPSPRIAP